MPAPAVGVIPPGAAPDPIDATIAAAAQHCAEEPLPQKAPVHYVCDCGPGADKGCVPGADSNDGRSPAHPWRSFDRAEDAFRTMAAGDTLAFCRGGVWSGDPHQWVNGACRAGHPCTVRDYTPPSAKGGQPPAPKIVGATISFANGGNAEHEEGYRFMNLELEGTRGAEDAIFVYNDVTDVELCNLDIHGYMIGINVQGGLEPAPGSNSQNARVSLRGSRVTDNKELGWLGACSACVVADNLFDHNGGASMTDHNVYLAGPRDYKGHLYPIVGMKVTGNKLRRSSRGAGTACKGTSLVVHGIYQDLLIEGNDILEEFGGAADSCWGIAVATAYQDAEAFRDVTIRRNRVVDMGNTSITLTSCAHCTIEDNLVIQTQPAFGAFGIVAGNRGQGRDSIDPPMDAVTIRYNTVILAGKSRRDESLGIVTPDEGTGHVIVGNAILGAGKFWSCFTGDLRPPAIQADYNLCWNHRTPDAWWGGLGSLAKAQAAGLDRHSQARDPKLPIANPSVHDLSPGQGSPLIGAGDPTNSPTTDLLGNPCRTPPDIGACQHGAK
jgi:hypothetical protein